MEVEKCIHGIDSILNGNKIQLEFIILINQIRSSGLLETITKVMSAPDIIVGRQIVVQTYLDFYQKLVEFNVLEEKLSKFQFLKLGTVYMKATENEVREWVEYQAGIHAEYPELEQLYV